ncbi:MAG TPA: response regulator [Patescibacteria group bacterium]|nr:response regulator [Patescibacteria group bacterium]
MKEKLTHSGEVHKGVLLVSDNQVDVQRIERQFMDTGSLACQMSHCSTIDDAIRHMGNTALKTDIIILDLRLKGTVLPLETYKRMSAGSAQTPIIALTGESDGEHAIGTMLIKAGAAGQTHRGKFDQLTGLIKSVIC